MKFKQPLSIREIAQWTKSEIIGPEDVYVSGLNEIHNVEEGDISFVDHEKYYDYTLRSAARVVIINKRVEAPAGKTLLYHENPFWVYNTLAKKYHPTLLSTARIGETAEIGEGSIVYPNAFVGEGVKIGRDCIIYPNVTIYAYTEIGDRVIIHANSTIGADAFYFKGRPEGFDKMHTAGKTVIHDDVEIGSGCTIDAGVSTDTVIGRGTKMDSQVHIGHDAQIGEHCIICAQVGIAGNTHLGNRVTMYGKSGASKNLKIGSGVSVMGASMVGTDLPNAGSYLGTPADELRTVAKQWALIRRLPEIWEKVKNL